MLRQQHKSAVLARQLCIRVADELVSDLRWSPDGGVLTVASATPIVLGWELSSGEQVAYRTGHDDLVVDLAWSPEGDQFAMLSPRDLYLLDHGSQQAHSVCQAPDRSEFTAFSWSPDGSLLALCERSSTAPRAGHQCGVVWVWERATGRALGTRPLVDDGFEQVGGAQVSWVVDGQQRQLVVSVGEDGTVLVWDPRTGRAAAPSSYRSCQGRVTAVVGAPRAAAVGAAIASSGRDGTLRVWSVETGQVLYVFAGTRPCRPARWSPDGCLLAFPDDDAVVQVVQIGSGRLVDSYTGHNGWVSRLSWSPDGSMLASASEECGEIRVWSLEG
jgi:WD40 repeat protein